MKLSSLVKLGLVGTVLVLIPHHNKKKAAAKLEPSQNNNQSQDQSLNKENGEKKRSKSLVMNLINSLFSK